MYKGFLLIMATLVLVELSIKADESELREMADSVVVDTLSTDEAISSTDTVYIYYFHGDRRCATCRKLEAYSHEAVENNFKDELAESTLVWKTVNYDDKENDHFIKDYGLFTKSLILSRTRDGKEIEWKNLDKIWRLVGNKEEFINYVRDETHTFLNDNNE